MEVAQETVVKKNVWESKWLDQVRGTALSTFHALSEGVGRILQYLCLVKKENEAWRQFVEDTQIYLVGTQGCCSKT